MTGIPREKRTVKQQADLTETRAVEQTAANVEQHDAIASAASAAVDQAESNAAVVEALGHVSSGITTLTESTNTAIKERRRQNRLVTWVSALFLLILVFQSIIIEQNRQANHTNAQSLRILEQATNPEAQAKQAEITQRALDDIAQEAYQRDQEVVNDIAALLGKPAPQLTPPVRKVSAVPTTTTTQPKRSSTTTKGTAAPPFGTTVRERPTTTAQTPPQTTSTTSCQPVVDGLCVPAP